MMNNQASSGGVLFNIDSCYLVSACNVPGVVLVDYHMFSHLQHPYQVGIMISQLHIYICKSEQLFKDHILQSRMSEPMFFLCH